MLTDRQVKLAKPRATEYELDAGGCPRLRLRVKPSGAKSWTLRYRVAGGQRRVTIGAYPALGLKRAREDALEILQRVGKGEDPSADRVRERAETRLLVELIDEYLAAAESRLRPATLRGYRAHLELFMAWAQRQHVRVPAELTRPRLAAFRDHVAALPRQKGEGKRRSPHAVNAELRSVVAFLNDLRRAGLLPVDSDAIRDCLGKVKAPREQPEFLRPKTIEKLLDAAMRHDALTFKATRSEHAGHGTPGATPRYRPIAPFIALLLTTGMRRGEALGLTWSEIDLDAKDAAGNVVGEIRLSAARTKTGIGRTIGLEVSPGLRRMLAVMKLAAGKGHAYVFGGEAPYSDTLVEGARRRLRSEFGAPDFAWQGLRRTCGTFLVNAPAIYGAASAFMAARQLGHSVAVAEKHYAGLYRGIARDADTLDDAMRIGDALAKLADSPVPSLRTAAS